MQRISTRKRRLLLTGLALERMSGMHLQGGSSSPGMQRVLSTADVRSLMRPKTSDSSKWGVVTFVRALLRTTLFYRLSKTLLASVGKKDDPDTPAEIHVLMNTYKHQQSETYMLEQVQQQLTTEINELHLARLQAEEQQLLKARVFRKFGQAFSLFWVYKLSTAAINIIFQRVRINDPVSKIISWVVLHTLDINFDFRTWSQAITFVFIGIIVTTQSKGFLTNIYKLFNAFSGHRGAASSLVIAAFAELMGMYFLSSVLLIRMNLPETYRDIVTKVLGDLEFQFYYSWFDLLFVTAASCSLLLLVATSPTAMELRRACSRSMRVHVLEANH
jgi:hypothetical protein